MSLTKTEKGRILQEIISFASEGVTRSRPVDGRRFVRAWTNFEDYMLQEWGLVDEKGNMIPEKEDKKLEKVK